MAILSVARPFLIPLVVALRRALAITTDWDQDFANAILNSTATSHAAWRPICPWVQRAIPVTRTGVTRPLFLHSIAHLSTVFGPDEDRSGFALDTTLAFFGAF